MKKTAITVLAICCFLLTSCGRTYENAKQTDEAFGGQYFTVVKQWRDSDTLEHFKIVYANDTKVKYLIWHSMYKGSITPLYNADGSLQIYDGE